MRKILFMILIMMATAARMSAQDDPQYRMEVGAGVGLVTYEGDFNGNIFAQMQPLGTVVGRYNIDAYKALKMGVSFGKLSGSSDKVETYYPEFEDASYSYGTGRDYRGAKRLTPFIFGGLGATYVKGGDKNVFTGNVPIGLGIKYKMSERVNVGLDWAIHFSLSDELDGVKDPYGIKSSGLFKNTDCYSALQLTLTYSFSAKCRTCNKED